MSTYTDDEMRAMLGGWRPPDESEQKDTRDFRRLSEAQGLTLATLCDMVLGENAADQSDDALIRGVRALLHKASRPCGAATILFRGGDHYDTGKLRTCELPVGHDGPHMAHYCGEPRTWK